ncbi:MAG: phosphoenolpyruvate carboxykinase (ATP), partial [Lachnospiraceae bacterium]|nr:phosphoenolpyruvate carboxykinase (ATP) [Lachnospiraceae bacterium]
MEDYLSKIKAKKVFKNLKPAVLIEEAVKRGEGSLTETGALLIKTGKYTGRSPKDKYIVDSEGVHDKIAWGSVNVPTKRETFDKIKNQIIDYLCDKDIFVFDGFAGADTKYRRKFRIVNEL